MASADQPNSQETNNNNVIIITRMDSKLFKAAINGEIQVFKNQLQLEQLLTPEKNTVVHVNIIATKTSSHNNTTTFLEGILEMCPQLLLQTNARGESPLHLAARYGHDLIVEFLIHRAKLLEPSDLEKAILGGVDSSEVVQHMMRLRNKELDTALHEAVRFNHLKVVRILTREDPHFTYLANEADETPLYMAVGAEYLDLCDKVNYILIFAAIFACSFSLTRKILEKLLDLTKQADKDGLIPLHHAVMSTSSNTLEIVKMLLEKDESSAYFKDKNGTTALHIAASNTFKGYKVVKEILSKCPDSYEVVDDKGRNLLHHVARTQNLSSFKLISDHFPLISNYLLNRKDNEGHTPLPHMHATSTWYPQKVDTMAYDLDYNEYNSSEQILSNAKKRKIERKEKIRARIANFRESTLVAAALIATVTFTAGFTLPGGYISDDKVGHGKQQQQGSAVLRNNTAFQVFIITDTIAMVLSTTSVFVNLFLTIASFGEDAKEEFVSNYIMSMNLAIFALGFMVIAFVTGTYAVLSLSNALSITICVIGLSFFVLLFFITKSKFKRVDFTNIGKLKPCYFVFEDNVRFSEIIYPI
ncbi:hypothetical protein F8388_000931 [Cannabis sativa]|uniref:PGG domain-containing protein n=1 Tax=Cannabis sativa TaxID=3483 RepID=A0A7J6FPX4_CANSA|nr:hypothetical protein F8388_000931 [Cannabis sativa]